ncbi:ABC transporter permease [Sciscionella sediminilitoris]|uniref:ABC transporter permease n=1 Tax=Sciscionella sediminilitoris TaxID=1445613 RepID=UPI0004DF9DA3|nr:ABC transporter permease [Sciscionella sp. SE31]
MTSGDATLAPGVSDRAEKSRSLGADAWRELRTNPLFLISCVIILIIVVMMAFPGLFTSVDPNIGDLSKARQSPGGDAWFGYDTQGRDIFARVIYGARASMLVGIGATVVQVVVGVLLGVLGGFFGRWVDVIVSRIGDIFFGLPFMLGAIVVLTTLNPPQSSPGQVAIILQVVLSIAVLSWPISMRLMRSATLTAKQQDYVKAARSLGASTPRIIFRHLLPNSIAPVMVYATIALGANIGAEATLSYLGVGLRPPVVSWGVMVSDAATYFETSPHMLLIPAGFVTFTVLGFVMLGDAVRDAMDPKSR